MSTTINSTVSTQTLAVGTDSAGYGRYKMLMNDIANQGSDSVSTVTVTNAGTGFLTVPTPTYTGGGGSGILSNANMKALSATVVAIGAGGYTPNEILTVVGGSFGDPAQLTINTTYLLFTAINNGGSSYLVNDVLTLVGGTHTGTITITVTAVDGGGAITAFSFITRGSFTVNSATFTSTGGTGTGATFNAATYNPLTVTITNDGFYQALPVNPVSVTGATGTGVTFNMTYGVETVDVSNGGQDYTSPPAVSFPSVSGSGAVATAALASVDDPITVSLAFDTLLPTDTYQVMALPNQAAVASSANKTTSGCDVILNPLNGDGLSAGTMDVVISFTA